MTKITKPENKTKFQRVINNNTFFFHNDEFEENYESYISSLTQSLLVLKQKVDSDGLKKEVFVDFVRRKDNGLRALLALLGFSKESLLRMVTFIRVYDDEELNSLVNKERWPKEDFDREWSFTRIKNLIKGDEGFAQGLVGLFFEGSTVPAIRNNLPLFEFKKLDINKLNFSTESLIDTIIRYKSKGSYSGKKENNPEGLLEEFFERNKIKYTRGSLKGVSRRMDFIIPNKQNPEIIIECSYVVTTSSGMGDKAKTEIAVGKQIAENYPNAVFLGFVDGIGWYVRRGDLERIVSAFTDTFTFHKAEIDRFGEILSDCLSKDCYE
jgi:hypothetical protein